MTTSQRSARKSLDTLGRRRRDTAVSRDEMVRITSRDLAWFESLHRHGPLPLPYLHAFTLKSGSSYHASTRRAAKLFHEGYLTRPHQQFATLDARCQTLVYDLSKSSREELRRNDLWRLHAPEPSPSHWRHDFMVSCITASIEIATMGTGLRYIHRDEILARSGSCLSFEVSRAESDKNISLRPDGIFGIQYPSGRARLLVLEADCATEVLTGANGRKTIERNAKLYQSFIGEKRYRAVLGSGAGMLVLNATSSPQRMANMVDVWATVHGGSCAYALFTCLPQFSRYFKPPAILTELLAHPYARIEHTEFALGVEL